MMMQSLIPDLSRKIYPEPPPTTQTRLLSMMTEYLPVDPFEDLPDSLLLIIFNKIGDVKSLGRCCAVSRRFHSLVPQVENVVVRVDCVISDDDASSSSSSTSADKSRGPFSNLFRIVLGSIVKPIQTLGLLFGPKRTYSSSSSSLSVGNVNGNYDDHDDDNDLDHAGGGVTHHSPTQVLKNFNEIKFLKIELPAGELGLEDDVLLRWRADFGSTLHNCVMLGASSVSYVDRCSMDGNDDNNNNNNGSIPESFYTNGGLKLRVVWTISSLIAASARHYLLQPIICEHKTLEELVLTDVDGQGVLCMNREQLEELRVKPLSASSASKRTLVPALNMRLWYAPLLELPDGTVLKGATLVCTRPSDQSAVQWEGTDAMWVSSAFEEPFGTAARMLVKRRTYCLEMNSF